MEITYIYALIDPRNGYVRYIGKTHRNPILRLNEHTLYYKEIESQNLKNKWILELRAENMIPKMEIIDEVEDWDFWERHYISLYKSWGFQLCNLKSGGQKGFKMTKKIYEVDEFNNIISIENSVKEMAIKYKLIASNLSNAALKNSKGEFIKRGGRFFTYLPEVKLNSLKKIRKKKDKPKINKPQMISRKEKLSFFLNLIP